MRSTWHQVSSRKQFKESKKKVESIGSNAYNEQLVQGGEGVLFQKEG